MGGSLGSRRQRLGHVGVGSLTEAPGLLQVSLCPNRRFWGSGTSSHPGWKAGCSWWESQRVLGNRPPPGLPAFPDSGLARGSLLQPSPRASLTGLGSQAASRDPE